MLKGAVCEIKLSRVYETEPMYLNNQPMFLNCVAMGNTAESPDSLLRFLQGIEQKMGRNRIHVPDKGPRIIDIDILLYERKIIHTDHLHIPHPGMYEREFVLLPLLELVPEIKDPESGSRFSDFIGSIEKQGVSVFADSKEIM